ncbi:TetR/AcrR family transcriptional regulator [Actinoalloteichus spitiensis]|uniref:TetR/AcrR family transcriptional regulator n=1 Tax=Actinoalloteichus spitiensis TaxID=252394 RepID=UPI00037652F7|nr:TetR/AcrR family transcriptional regulator [Actinoalloteichus spitiensis]
MAIDHEENPAPPDVPRAALLAWGRSPATTKGPRPKWTLERILEAGVRLGDEQGIDAITMSGVAKALGSGTMSLYRYVESREDLVVLTADRALGPGATPEGADWRNRLRAWVRDLRSAYERHPWLTAIPVGTEALLPSYLHRLESGLACLEPTGIPGERAVTVLTMLWTYTRGEVEQAAQLATLTEEATTGVNQVLAARLRALTGDALPRVLATLEQDTVSNSSNDDEFDAAISIVLDGLAPHAER